MKDRGMIKWAPFASLMNSQKVINEIMNDKDKINKPILNEDYLNILNTKFLDNSDEIVTIIYFADGLKHSITGKINKIDTINRYLIINQQKIKMSTILDLIC